MASTIAGINRSEGVVRSASFTIAADAAPSAVSFDCGFTPLSVKIANTTDGALSDWVPGLGTAPVLLGGTPSGFGSFSVTGAVVAFTPTASKALTVVITG